MDLPQGFQLDHDGAPQGAGAQLPPGFQLDEPSSAGAGASGDFDGANLPPGFQLDDDKYGSTGQQAIAGLEGVAKGIAGPAATFAETKLLGVKPEAIQGRAEANPWTHGLSEAAGFAGSAFAGTGEAALLGRAGEAAAGAVGLADAANTTQKLAKGAVTAATEMGLYQAGDELSKAMLNAPQTPGSVAANIGLSALLGGVTGPAFTGLGLVAKKALDSTGAKEFMDRLASRRAAGIDIPEMARNEADGVVQTFNQMGDEIGGANGLKAQAIQKVLPKEMTAEISNQVQDIGERATKAIEDMRKAGVPERYLTKLTDDANNFWNKSLKDPYETFDALNDFKKNLQDYSKGNWGPFAVPRYHEAYDFLSATKSLSRDVRTALEDSSVWGKAAGIQKDLNASWSKALPAMKDFEKKFMVDVGGEKQISADKFNTYFRQGIKNTTTTDRQRMMGNFVEAMDNHFNTVGKLYESAGVENPFPAAGMSALKESIERPSLGMRLADAWHDKIGPQAIGNTTGALVGGKIGSLLGHGLEGVYLGRELLGPAFSSVIKPIMEKYPNVDIGAVQQAYSFMKSIEKGENNLGKAVQSVFESGKIFPSQVIPSATDLEKLDEKAKGLGENASNMANIPGNIGYYMPDHGTSVAKTAGDAVTYLNSQRPEAKQGLPLDAKMPPSKADQAQFQRTLQIAQQPLMAFQHIKAGTLLPSDVHTLQALYPDYYNHMSQKLMEQVANSVHDGTKIPYKIKQSMSLFLGEPVDSTLLPQSIMSAQSVFMNQNQPAVAQAKPKGNKQKLSKIGDSYLTSNEASIKRRNDA